MWNNKLGVVTLYVPLFTVDCDVIRASVWGRGGRRGRRLRSHKAEQRTKNGLFQLLLRLNYLSEQHLGNVTV